MGREKTRTAKAAVRANCCIGMSSEAGIIRATVENAPADPLERRKWNVKGTLRATTSDEFWKWLVLSVLSSQQRYRLDSPTYKLENDEIEFPLPLSGMGTLNESDIAARLRSLGFRFHQRISKELVANYNWLFRDERGWDRLEPVLTGLLDQRNSAPDYKHRALERKAASELDDMLAGVGPKQARNLLQSLGLTRYEIPLDGRVVGWLQDRLGWSIVIEALSRKDYYEDLLDRVQASCEMAGVLPTLLDAAAFEEMGRTKTMEAYAPTCTGYVNRNGQVVVRNTRAPGTDKKQYVYQLACSHCGHVYGAIGSDIHERLCPQCQTGAKGLPYE
jgi:hypothetical protein